MSTVFRHATFLPILDARQVLACYVALGFILGFILTLSESSFLCVCTLAIPKPQSIPEVYEWGPISAL